MLPQIAQGESNKLWIIPSEFVAALSRLGNQLAAGGGEPPDGERRELPTDRS